MFLFQYIKDNKTKEALQEISLTVPRGNKIGIVGQTVWKPLPNYHGVYNIEQGDYKIGNTSL